MDGNEQAARRRYWAEQMDAADAFMRAIALQPVAESLEPVTALPDAARAAGVELDFSSRPHAHGGARAYVLRPSLVDDLLHVAVALATDGWRLRIEDGYRTAAMQRGLALMDAVFDRVVERTVWELDGAEPPTELLTRRLGAIVAASPKVATHMSASAVDVSVVDCRTGLDGDRGGPYLEVSERTPMTSPFVTAEQARLRELVTERMAERGFTAYPFEFWHFNRGDAYDAHLRGDTAPSGFGAVGVDLTTGAVTPLADPAAALAEPATVQRLLAEALERRERRHGSLGADSTSIRV